MTEFSIRVDFSHLLPEGSGQTAFPSLALAVKAIVDRCEGTWKDFAAGKQPLPSGRTIKIRTGEYLKSINHRMLGDYAGEVFTPLPYASAIEYGAPARDLKQMLNWSLKVRISNRTGRRFLIIPFRHDTGGAMSGGKPMPDSVRTWWEGKVASYVLSKSETRPVHSDIHGTIVPWHEVYAAIPAVKVPSSWKKLPLFGGSEHPLLTVPMRRYKWGTRLHAADLEALGASAKQVRQMAGMVNFRRPEGTGGGAHSRFITFRTMGENSKGWISPAREGYWPARTTADIYRPLAETLFNRAVEDDIRRRMPGG